jgi:hypothetical protein
MRRIAAATILLVGATVALTPNLAADAALPSFAMTTTPDAFHPPHTPPTGTFTASGLPGCSGGTYVDSLVYFTPQGNRVVVDENYTCLEGGTFTARMALHTGVIAPDGTQAIYGAWRVVAADNGIAGSGDLASVATGCSPVGAIFGDCSGVATGHIVGMLK